MKSSLVREITLYRFRYFIGYGLSALILFGLLVFGLDQAPRGLSPQEMQSAVTSVNINVLHPISTNVVDAPYHLLQKLSIKEFGLNTLAIKLPSIVLGAITGIAIILMLRLWFRNNVAILTSLIIVTSVGFLALARTGAPLIMTAFWTVMLLLGATYMLHSQKYRFFWKLFCFIGVALLAYSPLGIYPLVTLVVAGILHPHVRYRLKQGAMWKNILLCGAALIATTPLIIAIIHTPSIAMQLLGLDQIPDISLDTLGPRIVSVLAALFNFTASNSGTIMTPIFSITATILLLLGFFKLCTATYSARSYMLFIWIGLSIPLLILRPDAVLMVLIPASLIMAIGIETLIRQWYDLFPRNPYARIGALIPLSVLVVSIVGTNMERYFYGYHYSDGSSFHAELPALQKTLTEQKLGLNFPAVIVARSQDQAFYDLLRMKYPKLTVSLTLPDATEGYVSYIVLDDSPVQSTAIPTTIVTRDLKDASVLLRVYRN